MPGTARTWSTALLGLVLGVALVFLALSLYRLGKSETLITIAPVAQTEGPTVTVFVGGAVVRPGVYTLGREERIEGAIAAAGGFSPDADQDGINRALRLRDEGQVIVPRKGEPTATPARPSVGGGAALVAPAPSAAGTAPPGARGTATAAPAGRLNVNTATADELARLPGVGPKIAQDIVEYRTANGPFATPADLAKVRGISDRMVASWAELITVGP